MSIKTFQGLTIKIIKKIEELSPQEWFRVFPETIESYYFYKTIDESHFEQFSFYYILIYKKELLVGIAPCFSMVYSLATTVQGPLKNILLLLSKIFPRLFNLKAIMCGSPATEGAMGITGEDKSAVFEAILMGIEQVAREERAVGIVFKDFPARYAEFLDPFTHKGFCKMRGYAAVEIDIRFKTFDEYLKSLGRSSRKSLKRKFKKAAKLEKIDCQVTNSLGDSLDEAYRLYLHVFDKSEVHFEEYTRDFLEKISENMPREVRYFLWRIKGKLVAFNLCLVSQESLIDEFLGLDYSIAYTYGLYFITFRDIISWCIENGIKKYESGAMAYETKRRLGHSFIPLYIYATFMNKYLNCFIKILSFLFKPENFDDELKDVYKRLKK